MRVASFICLIGWAALVVLMVVAATGCSSTGELKAQVVELPVACDQCQKYNADLKGAPEFVSVCVCK